jgi:hypothetical protein
LRKTNKKAHGREKATSKEITLKFTGGSAKTCLQLICAIGNIVLDHFLGWVGRFFLRGYKKRKMPLNLPEPAHAKGRRG